MSIVEIAEPLFDMKTRGIPRTNLKLSPGQIYSHEVEKSASRRLRLTSSKPIVGCFRSLRTASPRPPLPRRVISHEVHLTNK